MTSSTKLDDDVYVAKLLAEDAKKSSLRYAQQGLSALLPRRAIGAAPKPNTRFLKSIVLEADNHNAALKRREELEARVRQRELRERSRHAHSDNPFRDRDDRPRKRRRYNDEDEQRVKRRSDQDRERCTVTSQQSRYPELRHDGGKPHAHDEDAVGTLRREHKPRSPVRSRSRDRGQGRPVADKIAKGCGRLRQRRRSLSARSPYLEDDRSGEQIDSTRAIKRSSRDESDSEPLEMLVGPLNRPREGSNIEEPPPITSKGRGAYKTSSAVMDAHFSLDYKPGLDVHPDSEPEDEREDWDMALEALRDREMFKQKQAERLREAGFGDAEIKKWEDSGRDKNIQDVKWAGKGQAREWDVGKNDQEDRPGRSGDNGSNGLEVAWKRKDGGFLKSFRSALR